MRLQTTPLLGARSPHVDGARPGCGRERRWVPLPASSRTLQHRPHRTAPICMFTTLALRGRPMGKRLPAGIVTMAGPRFELGTPRFSVAHAHSRWAGRHAGFDRWQGGSASCPAWSGCLRPRWGLRGIGMSCRCVGGCGLTSLGRASGERSERTRVGTELATLGLLTRSPRSAVIRFAPHRFTSIDDAETTKNQASDTAQRRATGASGSRRTRAGLSEGHGPAFGGGRHRAADRWDRRAAAACAPCPHAAQGLGLVGEGTGRG